LRLLLDTHVAIWAVAESDRLSLDTQALISDTDSEVCVSMCSLWEIAIKSGLGRRRLAPLPASDALKLFEQAGFDLLGIKAEHILGVANLPPLHGDPFDRLIVAQALYEPLRLVTHDKTLSGYSDTVIVC
jgi:PIN domain nuclease of toxin-antitoxin system